MGEKSADRFDMRTENEAVIRIVSKHKEYGFRTKKDFAEAAILSYEKNFAEGTETADEKLNRIVRSTVRTTLRELLEAGLIVYREPQKPEVDPEKMPETKSDTGEDEIFA